MYVSSLYIHVQMIQVSHPLQAAEALLSTEEEETPVPSPAPLTRDPVTTSTTSTATHPHTLHMAPPTTTAPPPPVNPEGMDKWLYQDPQRELQG